MFAFIDKWAENIYNYINPGSTKIDKVVEKSLNTNPGRYSYDSYLQMQQQSMANQQYQLQAQQAQATNQQTGSDKLRNAFRQKTYSIGQTFKRCISSVVVGWEYVEIIGLLKAENSDSSLLRINIHQVVIKTDGTKVYVPAKCEIFDIPTFESFKYTQMDSYQFLNEITEKRSF